ncbi:porin [Marinoscillum sp. MHG1-6]|uniref:porin n=1 Tax=Marinoscillum sp. MHG1-6 TaxID=2959627 RepID=UPI0021573E08|nr:porin [Marinoscillum sp. MHG1-6]
MKTFTNIFRGAVVAAVTLFSISTVSAQELSFSGSIDTYYRTNLNASNDVDADGWIHPGTSFANLPGFSLGMANLIASVEGEKSGFVADLVFGPRGTEAVFGSGPSQNIVNQLYAYWNVSDGVTLTLGNFNTFLGYEVISPTGNYNYSTSYMFSYGPFSHSGLKADIALGEASLMLGVFNNTDITDFNFTDHYYGGAQLGIGGQYINLLFSDNYFQADFTGGLDLTDAVYLGVNATFNNDLFAGGALYLQNSFSDDFSMGLRAEYFQDMGLNAITYVPEDESVIDLTLSANYSVGSLTFIPELRVDMYSQDVVVPEAGESPQGSLASFLVAAVYAF